MWRFFSLSRPDSQPLLFSSFTQSAFFASEHRASSPRPFAEKMECGHICFGCITHGFDRQVRSVKKTQAQVTLGLAF